MVGGASGITLRSITVPVQPDIESYSCWRTWGLPCLRCGLGYRFGTALDEEPREIQVTAF